MIRSSQCSICGESHEGLSLSFGAIAPIYYDSIPASERSNRTTLTSDVCVIDHEYFFVHGCLEVPIQGTLEGFSWGVWVSLSRTSFDRILRVWDLAGRESEPPYFGWLSTRLPDYPDTLNLKTEVHLRPVGQRPWVDLEPTDHPLAVHQRSGVPWETAVRISEALHHKGQGWPTT